MACLAVLLACLASAALSCAIRPEPISAPAPDQGAFVFGNYCAACHQDDGAGIEGGGPSLAESAWVRGPESRLIRIALQGLKGPVEVDGGIHDREMLSFGGVLSDAEIAAVITFIRKNWGGVETPIAPEAVGAIREATRGRIGYWTAEELLQIP